MTTREMPDDHIRFGSRACHCQACTGIGGPWVPPSKQPTPTMTPETREELWQAVAQSWDESSVRTADIAIATIAPIIERLVAERVAAETERCAKVAFAELDCGGPEACKTQQLKDGLCLQSYSGECGRDNAEDAASAIRSATR